LGRQAVFDLGAVYRKKVGSSPLKALKGRTFPDFKAHHKVIVVSRLSLVAGMEYDMMSLDSP